MLLCFELLLSEFHLLFGFDLVHTFFNDLVGLVEGLVLLGFLRMLLLVQTRLELLEVLSLKHQVTLWIE